MQLCCMFLLFFCIVSYFTNGNECISPFFLTNSPSTFIACPVPSSDSLKHDCRQLSGSLIIYCLTLFTWSPQWIQAVKTELISRTKWSWWCRQQPRWNLKRNNRICHAWRSQVKSIRKALWWLWHEGTEALKNHSAVVASLQQHFTNQSSDDCYLTVTKGSFFLSLSFISDGQLLNLLLNMLLTDIDSKVTH